MMHAHVHSTQVVDNNDDLESEDDNDSEPPEASNVDEELVDADADNTAPNHQRSADQVAPDQQLLHYQTQQGQPPPHRRAEIGSTATSGATDAKRQEQESDLVTKGTVAGRGSFGETGAAGVDRSGDDHRHDQETNHTVTDPWPGVDWGEGETGGTRGGGLVRRWGRVVEEPAEQPTNSSIDGDEFEQAPAMGEQGDERRLMENAGMRVVCRGGRGRGRRVLTTVAVASAAKAAAAAVRAAVDGESALRGGGGVGVRRDKCRGSGRAPKALTLSSGETVKHCPRSRRIVENWLSSGGLRFSLRRSACVLSVLFFCHLSCALDERAPTTPDLAI